MKILENNLQCQEVFDRIGLQEKINEDDSAEIEKYVCAIYHRTRLASVDKVRLELFLKKHKSKESKLISNMKKFDGSQLAPCSRVLKEKIKQTKYVYLLVIMAMIIQQQKYQVKWLDGLQPPQSIDVIQTEKEFDKGDINKDEGITF